MPENKGYFAGYDPDTYYKNWGRSASLSDKLGQGAIQAIISSGGFVPGQRDALAANVNRELGARTNLERALLGEQLSAIPGGRDTAFADARRGALVGQQQQALQSYLGNLDQAALQRQYDAISQLFGAETGQAARQSQEKQAKQAATASALGSLFEGAGQAIGESSKKIKKNIRPAKPRSLLKALKQIDLKKFEYKDMRDDGKEHTGMLAEEAPDPIAMPGRKTISLNDALSVVIGGLQALSKDVDRLKRRKNG